MKLFNKFFRQEKNLCQSDLIKPYCQKAKQLVQDKDYLRAMAHLDCGIKMAPKALELYLQRAYILQYGLCQFADAIREYRFILRELETRPDEELATQCRKAIKEMMELAPARV